MYNNVSKIASACSAAIALGCILSATGSPAAAQTSGQPAYDYAQLNVGSGLGGSSDLSILIPGLPENSSGASPNAGVFASAAAGRSFGNGLSVEVEGVYTNNNLQSSYLNQLAGSDVKFTATTYDGLVNLIYSTPPIVGISPYAGAGAGYGGSDYGIDGSSKTDGSFVWQLKAGVTVPVTSRILIDFGYRYLATPKLTTTENVSDGVYEIPVTIKASTDLQVLSVGARLKF